jgi:hypothetical protein
MPKVLVSTQAPKRKKIELSYGPTIPLLNITERIESKEEKR